MSFDARWPRWIKSSIAKHFDDNKGARLLFIEGEERKTNVAEWLELRIDGPYTKEIARDIFDITFEVNILIQVNANRDLYAVDRAIGDVMVMFAESILVKAYADGEASLGCLSLYKGDFDMALVTHQFGQVEPKTRLLQATVEGRYRIILP